MMGEGLRVSFFYREDAACLDSDPEGWFPEQGDMGSVHMAKKICNTICPVRDECLEWALESKVEFGIFGGKGWRWRRGEISRREQASGAA